MSALAAAAASFALWAFTWQVGRWLNGVLQGRSPLAEHVKASTGPGWEWNPQPRVDLSLEAHATDKQNQTQAERLGFPLYETPVSVAISQLEKFALKKNITGFLGHAKEMINADLRVLS